RRGDFGRHGLTQVRRGRAYSCSAPIAPDKSRWDRTDMRAVLYAFAVLALAAAVSPGVVRDLLATAASTLFESIPYLVGGAALSRIAHMRRLDLTAYLGCGCGRGPGARSLPAAAAAWLLFGPVVALARVSAAVLVAQLLRRRLGNDAHAHPSF